MGGNMNHDFSKATVTNSNVSVGATTTVVLAARGKRSYAYLVNASNETLYLALGGAAVLNKGIALPVGAAFEIGGDAPYQGAINAISTSGSKNLTVLEA